MRKILLIGFLFLSALLSGAPKEKVYLFSCVKGNGEDGPHLVYSRDGYNFTTLNNDTSPVLNVRDFGAKGDSVTIETDPINKAIDAASAQGAEHYRIKELIKLLP